MAELPQLSETQPVLNVQQVNSAASGYEAFGKVLEKLSSQSAEKATSIVEEQSNASFLQSANQAKTIETNAQIDMLKHPDQAGRIAEHASSDLDVLNKSAFVNKSDRMRLQSITGGTFNDLRAKAATIEYQQSQKNISLAFWDEYPKTMKSIQDALDSGNFEQAKVLEESLHTAAVGAAKMGAITPTQFGSIRQSNFDLYSRTEELHKLAGNPENHSAAGYHAATNSPFNSSNQNTSYPAEGHTQWMAGHLNFDRSFSGQMTALYNDEPLNWGVIAQGNEHEYNDFKMQWMGVNQIKSSVHAGVAFSEIETHIKALEAKPKLSPIETGQVNYWRSLKANVQNDDGYLKLMSQTTLGGQTIQEYNQRQVAIQDSALTPNQKFQAQRDNDNDFIGRMVSLGRDAQHADPSMVQPIPAATVNTVRSAFVKNAPVANALAAIEYVKPEYRAYIANTMEKPNQVVSVLLAGVTSGKADPGFQAQLLEANQTRDYSGLLKTGKDETQDRNIWQDISFDSRVIEVNTYLSKLPGGIDIQDGFKQSAVNYVLYRAAKEGDININGKAQYIQDFISNTAKGFDIQQGAHYYFNNANLNLRQADLDVLADYAVSSAYKAIHEGQSEEQFQAYMDINQLHATNTPDGRIVVIDKMGHAAVTLDGHEAFDQPYTSNMLDYAHNEIRQTKKYMAQYFGFSEDQQRAARLTPGYPFISSGAPSNVVGAVESEAKTVKADYDAGISKIRKKAKRGFPFASQTSADSNVKAMLSKERE